MFKVSQTDGSVKGFLNLFAIHTFAERGIAFYRPIFREALHNIYYSSFGLNHLPFRIILMFIHLINISLVYILIKKIFQKEILAIFVAFFFGITAANVSLLYYLAGGIEASGATMFSLLTLILYREYLIKLKTKWLIFSFITFILAITSHEIVIILPFILLLLSLTSSKKSLKDLLKLSPFFILAAFILYIDIVKIGFSTSEEQYHFILNPKSFINSFAWYLAWALGLPETLIDFVQPGLKLNPVLMRYWGNYYKIILPAFFLSISLIFSIFVYLFIKSKKVFKDKNFLFFFFWFPIGIFPVIFLPAHKSTHYLVFVLPAFWAVIGYLNLKFLDKLRITHPKIAPTILIILFTSLFTLSVTSIKLEDTTYWAAGRGRLAEKIINQVRSTYPTLPKESSIYFTDDPNYPFISSEWGGTSKQASLILNGVDAIQLLYKDPSIKVFYEDLQKPPENLKVYPLVVNLD